MVKSDTKNICYLWKKTLTLIKDLMIILLKHKVKKDTPLHDSVIKLLSKSHEHLKKYINNTESCIKKAENILTEFTQEERYDALNVDMWYI